VLPDLNSCFHETGDQQSDRQTPGMHRQITEGYPQAWKSVKNGKLPSPSTVTPHTTFIKPFSGVTGIWTAVGITSKKSMQLLCNHNSRVPWFE
jgi:hypothetical protein